jgi:hypothetical protein
VASAQVTIERRENAMPGATVNATSVNLRDAPSADATIVAVLPQGASVDLLADNDDGTWLFVSTLVAAVTRLGWVRADLVTAGVSPPPDTDEPGPHTPDTEPKPIGDPLPFSTKPSASGNARGTSSTTGLRGTEQKFNDGSLITRATEQLAATRTDGLDATLTASCRRVRNGGVTTVQQDDYCYSGRKLPLATLFLTSDGIPAEAPAGFAATAVRVVIASQFGKNDRQDEGTGSPVMGLVQTNSEVFGASIKVSKMVEHFGENWRKDPRRLGALIEVHSAKSGRRLRVPLVDVGPAEAIPAEVDLTWACDQFLQTKGQGEVSYRLFIPS